MVLPRPISPDDAERLVEEWAAGATLGDLAIRYLGYSARDPLGTRASAVHRFLRDLFDSTGYSSWSLHDIRRSYQQERHRILPLFRSSVQASRSEEAAPQPVQPQPRPECGVRKILVLSDLHIPFHHVEMIDWAITRESDADELVLLGDIWDMYAASRFVKNRGIDVVEELEIGYELLLGWLSHYERVVVVLGNHDLRPTRLVAREHPEVLPLVFNPLDYVRYQLIAQGRQDLLERLVQPSYPVRGSHPDRPVSTECLYLVGDAVLGHFEVSRKGPANTVWRLAMEWLPVWGPLVGAVDVRVLVQGHVHRLSKSLYGKLTIIESGCCSHVLDYTIHSPLAYGPPGLGYVVLYQQDGCTDVNRSGYFVYDIYG